MADRDEKIFPALPQKRQRAREQGQVARSRDLTSAISFAGGILVVAGATTFLGRITLGGFQALLATTESGDIPAAFSRAFGWPFIAASVAAVVLALTSLVGAVAQGGIVFSLEKLSPDLTRLNPVSYFGRIFSMVGLAELGKSGLKIVAIVLLGWWTAKWALSLAIAAHGVTGGLAALLLAGHRILYLSALIALAVAIGDYLHKRYEFEADLRMTRQEFLDELKLENGNPLIKRAQRKAARKNFKRIKGVHQAATATVVLTNPTHFAVALRYRRGFDQAPLVVAKGAGENAQRIKEIARMAAVPVMENKPLARALFKTVEVGDYIPRQFYRAIAEVLATIMRAEAARTRAAEQGIA
jgi:flagellar biosynthesis protein FlhB